jgi:hypothetical protein
MAERQGDEIVVNWEIQEDHADLSTLKLEYRTADAPALIWYTATAPQALTGQARFRFMNAGPVSIRLQITDQAGNLGSAEKEIPAQQTNASLPVPGTGARPGDSKAAAAGFVIPTANAGTGQVIPSLGNSGPAFPAPLYTNGPSGSAGSPTEKQSVIQPTSLRQSDQRGVGEHSWNPSGTTGFQQTRTGSVDSPGRPVATASSSSHSSPAQMRSNWAGGIIPLEITNNTQVSLNYEVTKIGHSGLGRVQLYLTNDEGRSWQHYADDPGLKPPMTVSLPGEGTFGLRLVVISRAGLGKPPPQPGDPPQMRIQVDLTPPQAKLFVPEAAPNRQNALLLRWNASDSNLATGPITLCWRERPDGEWKPIVECHPNTGNFIWPLPANIPYRVYLQLIVKDIAGNITIEESPEPVLIDLQEPEVQLLGLGGTVRKP